MMSLVKVTNAYKEYRSKSDTKKIFNNLNLNVKKGTVYALMGSSGCGKTTLISCLVGILNLDRGKIEVFGEPTRRNKRRIGYMPQEIALVNDFTIKEMIWFFGTIFSLSSEKIAERLSFLSNLLELPDNTRLIRDCSGGQQRRISFALTLVHEPELLILDEPTVGLDPVLRNKIWDYFTEITETKDVTILISTHYIEEARNSNYLGLLRNGIQVAEDTPENILIMMQTTNLEEAFLRLSEQQDHDPTKHNAVEFSSREDDPTTMGTEPFSTRAVTKKPSSWLIFYALFIRNLIKIRRNIEVLFISVYSPMILCVCMQYAIGGNIKGLTLGIVNHEVTTVNECLNNSLMAFDVRGFHCKIHKLSCMFIDELHDNVAKKKYFDTYDDAYQATKSRKVIGFIYFTPNFTQSLVSNSDNMHVYLDQSDFQITTMIQRKLIETYENFTQTLTTNCGNIGNAGLIVEAAYGKINFDFKVNIVPGFLILSYFSVACYITSLSIVTSRTDGTWNRIIVAGASSTHFLWAHLVEGLIIVILQFTVYMCYISFFMLTAPTWNSLVLISLLLLLIGFSGLTFGLLLSIVMRNEMEALIVGQVFAYPAALISGVMWPSEGMPLLLRYFGSLLPFLTPVAAFRNIIIKNSTISDQSVYQAILVLSTWTIVQLFLSFWFIREKNEKKTKNKD